MKKLFIAALIVLAAGSSAFALDVTKSVSNKLRSSFDVLYPGARNVAWEEGKDFLSASFTLDEVKQTAFFTKEGEVIGTSQHVELGKLPSKALNRIKKEYASYKITDSIEFTQNEQSSFYVMVEDGNKKIALEITAYGNVSVFSGKLK